MKNKEQGFILLITLVWLITLSLLAVGILSSTRNSLKNEKRWVGMDECYMYGRMALDSARAKIINDSEKYFDDNAGELGAFEDWFNDRLPALETELAAATSLSGVDPVGEAWPTSWQDATYTAEITDSIWSDRRIDFLLKVVATMNGGQRAFEQHFKITMGAAIFNYAYFINNNGWLHSNTMHTFYINGDIGANANFSLAGGTVLNGTVFAAKRNPDEIRDPSGEVVDGVVTNKDGDPDYSGYESLDKDDYMKWLDNHSEAMARGVLDTTGMTDKEIAESSLYNPELMELGGRMPATEGADPLKMPFLGELESYAEEAKEAAAVGLSRLDYIDENGNPQSITDGVVDGNLIITGDFSIIGKIVVKGDLIIRTGENGYGGLSDTDLSETYENLKDSGMTTEEIAEKIASANGKGAFFVDRNINIIGDLKSNTGENGEEDPFLSLAARGNIIMGDTRDIDMGLISNQDIDKNSGQMVPYITDDPMYQNLDGTKFDGNYSLPEKDPDARAGKEGAISLGSNNVYQQYKQVITYTDVIDKVKLQPKKEQERYEKIYEDGKLKEEIRYTRWINYGTPTYEATSGIETIWTDWEDTGETKTNRIVIYEKGEPKYIPRMQRVVVGTSPDIKGTDTSESLLWEKVEFWKSTGKSDETAVKVEIDGEFYQVTAVGDKNNKRYYNDQGDEIKGYVLWLDRATPSIISGGSATVDRAYFENKMPIEDYWRLKPTAPQHIDAVLYTNHLIAGALKPDGALNGAMVARDEALKIVKDADTKTFFSFNWDTRLGDNENASNSYLQESMQALMPATLGGGKSSDNGGVIFTRETSL